MLAVMNGHFSGHRFGDQGFVLSCIRVWKSIVITGIGDGDPDLMAFFEGERDAGNAYDVFHHILEGA